jgi:hypothetical protein
MSASCVDDGVVEMATAHDDASRGSRSLGHKRCINFMQPISQFTLHPHVLPSFGPSC